MNVGTTLFSQLMDFLPWTTFTRIVDRHDGDRYEAEQWGPALRFTLEKLNVVCKACPHDFPHNGDPHSLW